MWSQVQTEILEAKIFEKQIQLSLIYFGSPGEGGDLLGLRAGLDGFIVVFI
jgi:hypothetical protein